MYLVLVLVYYFALEATIGQTLGKLLLGLGVVRPDGSRPSVAAIALRTLLRIVDWLPLLYLVGFITIMVTGQRRQRLGDLAGKTGVAQQQPVRRRSLAVPPVALLLLLIVALSVYRATDSGGGTNTLTLRLPVNTTVRLPHNSVRPAATGAVLFRDDFSNKQSGWYVHEDRHGVFGYLNGSYRITLRTTFFNAASWKDVDHPSKAMSVTAVLRQSDASGHDELGVACIATRPTRKTHGYVLGIDPGDGSTVVAELSGVQLIASFDVVKRVGADAIEPRGEPNRIRADCFGAHGRTPAQLTLYANGKLIAEAAVPHGYKRFDRVGVYAYNDTDETTAFFDDLVVRELKPTG